MTEHTGEPADDHSTESAAEPPAAEAPTAHVPPATPPGPVPGPAQPMPGWYPVPPPGFGPAAPFAPVSKEPWFNPAKRTSIVVAAVIAALILLGGGFAIGAVTTHHRGDRGPRISFYGPGVGPGLGQRVFPNGVRPRQRTAPFYGNGPTNVPSQLPSASTSS